MEIGKEAEQPVEYPEPLAPGQQPVHEPSPQVVPAEPVKEPAHAELLLAELNRRAGEFIDG